MEYKMLYKLLYYKYYIKNEIWISQGLVQAETCIYNSLVQVLFKYLEHHAE